MLAEHFLTRLTFWCYFLSVVACRHIFIVHVFGSLSRSKILLAYDVGNRQSYHDAFDTLLSLHQAPLSRFTFYRYHCYLWPPLPQVTSRSKFAWNIACLKLCSFSILNALRLSQSRVSYFMPGNNLSRRNCNCEEMSRDKETRLFLVHSTESVQSSTTHHHVQVVNVSRM